MKQAILLLVIGLSGFSGKMSFAQNPDWLWAKCAGGSDDKAKSVAVGASGNVYIAGKFISKQIAFDSTSLQNKCWSSMFLVKYDANGNVLWAKSTGKDTYDDAVSIALDASENIYVAGEFNSTFEGPTVKIIYRNTSIFVSKYDSSGEVLWRKNISGSKDIEIASAATDPTGNIYIAGGFNSPRINFGSSVLNNSDKTGNSKDMYFAKYDANGNFLWAKSAGGAYDDWASSIATDASGSVYVAGRFFLDTLPSGTIISTRKAGMMLLLKCDANGNLLWSKCDEAGAKSIAVDVSGNIYVAGWFQSISFGARTVQTLSPDEPNIFLLKCDANGKVLWGKSIGCSKNADEGAKSVATDAAGNPYLAGLFPNPATIFGSAAMVNFNSSGNKVDFIVAKYDINGNVQWASGTGTSSIAYPSSLALDASANVYVTGSLLNSPNSIGSIILTSPVAGYQAVFIAKLGKK
ncbi:MAG: hypothetical protein NTW31_05905 [Bacteroidetes bacterium]|nr:hypothetical protein [Bacteroidota bacterium]